MLKLMGGYKKPHLIQNAELLKDPTIIQEIQRQSQINPGSMSPTSIGGGGRKLAGGSQNGMSHLYMILKDDLIEHFDYEAVNQ